MGVLDSYLKHTRADLSAVKKKRRRLLKQEVNVDELDREIEAHEQHLRNFMKSRMEPVKAGDLVINNKVYEPFMRKLKGMSYVTTIHRDKLVVEYGPNRASRNGRLELYDLSHFFEGFGVITKEADLHGTVQRADTV